MLKSNFSKARRAEEGREGKIICFVKTKMRGDGGREQMGVGWDVGGPD